jgi:ATP-dependent DNA helicase RecG
MMRTSLPNLLAHGPSQTTAFLPALDAGMLAETLVAFANADGGTVLVGVDSQGQVHASLLAEDVEAVLARALGMCRPPVVTQWGQAEMPHGTVVHINVARSPELHSLADGRVLVRHADENQPLGGDAIRQLAATKSSADFEAEPVAGATRADLDDDIIAEYMDKRAERGRRPINGSVDEHLTTSGALTEDGRPTTSGVLLFGRYPQEFLPQSGIVFVRFEGSEPRGKDGLAGYGRRVEMEGPLARLVEAAWNITWQEMRVGAVVVGLKREEQPEYPGFAVREALVNAIAHRDYRLTGRRVEIRMFEDRLEVISPGGLPGYITVDNIVEEHFSRNPRLVAGLFQWGYIEELGLGIDRMIEEMLQHGHPSPEFRATPYSFTVTLRKTRERRPIPVWEHNMNERQLRALAYVREFGRITNREYHDLCPSVSPETLRLDLADLVEKNLLLKIGDKRGTYYILK